MKSKKEVVAKVSARVGGVIGARAPGQLPRGEAQVSMIKQKCKISEGDQLYIVMQQAKAGENYVRDVKAAPDPAIIIVSDKQLHDLARFCATTGESDFSIMTYPTFSLSDFECTPITYSNLHLETRRYKKIQFSLGLFLYIIVKTLALSTILLQPLCLCVGSCSVFDHLVLMVKRL